jgi:hypothetical protein
MRRRILLETGDGRDVLYPYWDAGMSIRQVNE